MATENPSATLSHQTIAASAKHLEHSALVQPDSTDRRAPLAFPLAALVGVWAL